MSYTFKQLMIFTVLSCCSTQLYSQSVLPVVLDTIVVGGSGSMDYITCDTIARRLYISHSTCVEVVQYDTKTRIGSIEKTTGVHGIALASEFSRGFTSNGKSNDVTVFDLKTLAVVRTVDVKGKKPDAILYEPATKRVFTFNGESENCTAIDASTMTVVGSLDLGGSPEGPVADGNGDIYVNIENKNEIVRFDAASLKIRSRWPLGPAETPTGLSMDRKNRVLFAGGRNQVFVALSANDGHILASFPIGKGVDGTAFDANMGLIYVSNKDGSLDIMREEGPLKFTAVGKVLTSPGAKTLALDPQLHRVFLPAVRQMDGQGRLKGEMMVIVVGMKE